MFCANCGILIQPGSRFCSSCGTELTHPPMPGAASESAGGGSQARPDARPSGSGREAYGEWRSTSNPPKQRQLVRLRSPRMIAGVCSGLAQHYGWDLNLVRIFVALISIFYGIGVVAYFAAWIIVPEAPYSIPTSV